MQAIKETYHIKNKILHMQVPASFNDQDVEVIVRPSQQENKSGFKPAEFYGITDVPAERIQRDSEELRKQWNRRI